ncbi:hypothetical protein SUGI_0331260 [Cryptomeria japonica]|nr:hypothetical protein SUGI_0331260 [Cryptomeria japonica]
MQHYQKQESVGGYGLAGGQGFYTLESLEASHQQHHLYPPGTSYSLPSDGTIPPGSYAPDMKAQLEQTPHDRLTAYHYQHQQQGHMSLAAQGSYGSAQTDFGRAGGLVASYGRDSSLYPRLAPGSIPPPRYAPEEQYVPQEGHTPWYRNETLSGSSSVLLQQQSSLPFSAGAEFRPSHLSLPYRGLPMPSSKSQVLNSGSSGIFKKKMASQFKHIPAFKKKSSKMGPPKHPQPVVSGPGGPGWCSVCEIECNSGEVLETHCLGRKHRRRLEKKEELLAFQKKVNENHMQQPGTGNIEENLKIDDKNNMHTPLGSIQTNAKKKQNDLSDIKSQADQQQMVTVKIEHPDKNQNQEGEADAKASNSNQGKRKQKAKAADNLDTKRQRLLDAGTLISDLKVCTLCNAVCNSQIVFESHLAGKKHTAQVKKLEEEANAVSQGNKVVEEANAVTAGNEIKEEATADSQRNTTEEEASGDSEGGDSDNESIADGEVDGEDGKAD